MRTIAIAASTGASQAATGTAFVVDKGLDSAQRWNVAQTRDIVPEGLGKPNARIKDDIPPAHARAQCGLAAIAQLGNDSVDNGPIVIGCQIGAPVARLQDGRVAGI